MQTGTRGRFAMAGVSCWAGLLLALTTPATAGLYDTWGYRSTIQFSGYNKGETLNNFPVLVVLSTANISGFDYSQFLSGSNADLRFTDSTGLIDLNYEVEKWDSSGNSYVWVKVPALVDATTAIIAFWGTAGQSAPAATNAQAVWEDGFRLVEHMAINNGTTVADATASNRLATISGAYSYTNSGLIGNALRLGTGRNSGLLANSNIPLGANWTISTWFKDLQPTGDWRTLVRGPTSHHQVIIQDSSDKLGAYIGGFSQAGAATLAVASRWRHFAAVGTGNTTTMYVDGVAIGTGSFQSTEDVYAIGWYQGGSQKFADYLDEFRIDGSARSANWVWASYMNTASNATVFQTYGAATSSGGPRPPVVANLAASNVVSGAAFLNGRIASTGNAPVTAVALYWGTSSGGTNAALWANTNAFAGGAWNQNDLLTTNITTLAADQNYYYAYFATNSDGGAWGTPAQYFISGALTFSSTDTAFSATSGDTATVLVSRPGACTNQALTVYYTLGGTGVNGVDYGINPASGFSIPAGQASALITVSYPGAHYFGTPKSVTVTLAPGAYVTGGASNTTCSLVGELVVGYAGAKIYWADGDGSTGVIASTVWGNNNTLDYAVWDQIQTAIGLAGNNPATPGTVKLAGNFTRTLEDTSVGTLQFTNANLSLSGGWDSSFTTQSGKSVLNVNGSAAGANQFRVMQITATNVLVGNAVVTNGYVNSVGGGIYVTGDQATLQNLRVVGNIGIGSYNVGRGGGIGIIDAVGVRVRNSEIVNNVGWSGAGGISIENAGVVSNPVVIENCSIVSNTTMGANYMYVSSGGGIQFSQGSGSPTKGYAYVLNTQIVGNRAKDGAGIRSGTWDTSPRLVLFGCLIAGNYSTRKAGDSYGGGNGNAIIAGGDSITILANCTLVGNTHPQDAAQYGVYTFPGTYGMWGRITFINCISAQNNLGVYDLRQSSAYATTGTHIDYLHSTVLETDFHEVDQGPDGGPVPPNVDQITNTLAGALAFANPGFHSLTDTGSLSQAIEQNIDGPANFRGKDPAPYQLTTASANALNNGVTKIDNRGFRYVDVNLDNVYTTNTDIIVSGTAPAGGPHLVYTTDLLGNPRVSGLEIDRGAYESQIISGTALYFR